MQNSDNDICLKIDEAIYDTRNLLLSIAKNQINRTAFKLVRKVTCKRKRRSKTRRTSHRKSLDAMKVEVQNVPIPILPESKKNFNESLWQNLPMTTSLARRNFRNPLPQVHKYDSIVVVLDTTKPGTNYKYPIEKPAYQSGRMNIDLSDVSLKINLLPSVTVTESDVDSLDLNDRVLATELNKEYNKIMHIETVFNSPNRIIKVVKYEEFDTPVCAKDSEEVVVTPEEQKQGLSVILEDIVVQENITPIHNQVNLKLALESSAFIMHETDGNISSGINPLESSHIETEFSSICDSPNMQIEHEHESSSLDSSGFINSRIDNNNSIALKHSMNNCNLGKLNSNECKANFDNFPFCSVLKDMKTSTTESILIADSTFSNSLSKDNTKQNVREFLCNNEIEIDQPSDSLLISYKFQKISNDQPVETVCDNVTKFSYSCTSETATQFHLNDQKRYTKLPISTTQNAINNIPKGKDFQLAVTSSQFLDVKVEQSISCEATLNNNLTKENIAGPVSCELASNANPINIPFIKINNHPPSFECTITKSSNHDNNSGQCISNRPMAICNFSKEDILKRNNDEIAYTKSMSIDDIAKLSSNKRIPPIDAPNFSDQLLMPVPTLQIYTPNLPYTSTETGDIIKLSPISNICESAFITKPLVTSVSCHSQSTVYSDLPSSLQGEHSADVSTTTTNLSDAQIKTNQNLPLECVVLTSNKSDGLPVSSDRIVGLDLIKTEFGNMVAKGDGDYSSLVAELYNVTNMNTDEVVTLESGIFTNVYQGLSSVLPNVSDFSSDIPLSVKLIDFIKYSSYIEVPKNSDSLAKTKNDLPKSSTEELSNVQKTDTDEIISIESDFLTDSANSHSVEVSEILSTLTVVSDLPKFDVTNDLPKNSIDSSHCSVPEAINFNNKINDSAKCLVVEVSESPTTLTVVSKLPKFEVDNDFSQNSIDSSNFSVPEEATNIHNKTNICLQDSNLVKVDPFASLDNVDFVKAKQTLLASECEQNCVNIFCAHKKISHNTASQTRQGTMTSSSKLNLGENRIKSESDIRGSSEFIIYDCSNDQFKSCNKLSRTENLQLTPSTTPNKVSQSSNATATTVGKTKTTVKRSAESEKSSQNKCRKTDENRDNVNQKSKHKAGGSNNSRSRWPLYNFSKPADCFEAVQSAWDGLPLPDPHVDLTSRFHDNPLHFHSNFSITGSDSRTIECLSIYESQIDNVEREIRNIECNLDQFGHTLSRRCINENLSELQRLKSFRAKLLSACEEANRFYTYYRDRRTGWNAFYISEYQKNVIENILHEVLSIYPSYYNNR